MSITIKGGVNAKGSYVPLPPPTLPWVAVAETPGYETSRRWYNEWFPAGGVFVEYGAAILANSPQGALMYSTDGTSYSLANAPDVPGPTYYDYGSKPAIVGNEVFWYCTDENGILPTYLYRSTDGINWTSQQLANVSGTASTPVQYWFYYGNGATEFLANLGDGRLSRTTDGINWIATTPQFNNVLTGVGTMHYDYKNSRWCLYTLKYVDNIDWIVESNNVQFSYDGGITFGAPIVTNIPPGFSLYEIVAGPNNEFIGAGYSNGSNNDVFYRSTDLINWTVTYDVPQLPGKWLGGALLYVPGVGYLSTGAASYATSSDGINWKRTHAAHGYYRCYNNAQSPTVVAAPQSSATSGVIPAHFYFNKSEVTFENLPPLVPLPTDTETDAVPMDINDLPPHLRDPNGPWARRMQQLSKK